MAEAMPQMAPDKFRACIDACNACAVACLQERDPKPMARCVALEHRQR